MGRELRGHVLGLAALLAFGCQAQGPDDAPSDASFSVRHTTLGTPDQLWLEEKLLAVLASPEVARQRERGRAVYETDPQAAYEAGRRTMVAALDSIAGAMVQWAVNDDPSRPRLLWSNQAAHEWFGLRVPQAGYGIENPDNVYRHALIDGVSAYRIEGRRRPPAASQQSFTLYSILPGTTAMEREGSPIIGALDEVEIDEDGRFVVTVDARPAEGRKNHIQSSPETAILIVRDSLTDWSRENASELSIERVDGPPAGPAPTVREMAERAAWLMERTIPFWAEYDRRYIFSRPANRVVPPRVRGGGWGFSTAGHFVLEADEAWVVTLSTLGARYLGFQLADPWGVGLPYVDRSGSLNASQARLNPDGSLSFVISASDPGVYNWIDTAGLDRGIFAIRWQNLEASVESAEAGVVEARVVRLDKLESALPIGTARITPADRARQLARRARNYARRFE